MLLALAVLAAPLAVRADVVQLLDGDRISGRVSKRKTTVTLKTAFGSLTIPRSKIAKIVWDDGSEEVVNVAPQPAPTSPPPRLVLVVTGQAFWYAWSPPKGTAVDPTLRLQVSLDEEPLATYADATPDPADLPGALINSFSFEPEVVVPAASGEARVLPPETRPGRAVLKIELPPATSHNLRLRLAYQVNEASAESPAWRDCVEAVLNLELREDGPTFVHVSQSRGNMEFSGFLRRKMKRVETFRLEARPDLEPGEPSAP
jgi:hypothetical protein